MTVKVVLADDHAIVRDGLRAYLRTQTDLRIVAEAATGREAVAQTKALRPDVVVMDFGMPEMNGVEATRQVKEVSPSTRVIMLSIHADFEYVRFALQAGAKGYLVKTSAGTELLEAIRAVMDGRQYLSQKVAHVVWAERFRSGPVQEANPLAALSKREREVLQLVAEGRSSAEIAKLVGLSRKTVETYRSRLMEKLGVENVVELIKFAIKHRVTSLE